MSEPCTCALSQVVPLTPEVKQLLVDYYREEIEVRFRKSARCITATGKEMRRLYEAFGRERGRALQLSDIAHLLAQH